MMCVPFWIYIPLFFFGGIGLAHVFMTRIMRR
jgi:hypothetical protein